ncbi:hypothetical protein LO772_11790 [Yinghuangia sp. ASG 101]|uniref:hypothetical protein n=1 Tax=Yinghuangia sp. ASG 101 TaxID=2896848 RepID=UPI001E5AA98A|nr:hypothetical protein [Yinghuangia sp. ASG 101]UGQ14207.1 hypothetical protein LO772_11790 [Yinghuangia sp. ASG 101]
MDTHDSHDPFLIPLPLGLPVPVRGPAWLDEVVRRQSGVATIRQLRRGGVSDDKRRRYVRQGTWLRVAPNVVVLASSRPTRRQSVVAALLHAGGGALATGLTALELADATGVRHGADIHVLVPRRCTAKPPPAVVFERTARLPEPLPLRAPPRAPHARAAVDACRRLLAGAGHLGRRQARATALAVVQQRLCDVAELRAECEGGPRRLRRRMRAIVDEVAAGVRSLPEADLRVLVRASELPEPLWNPRVYRLDGAFLCSPDGLWADEAVAVEVDSVSHHGFGADRARTEERARLMRAAGLTVVSVLPRQIRDAGAEVVRRLRDALREARARPREHLALAVHPI